MLLFLVFVAVPLIEIALFIQVGGLIGLWPTLLVVVLTALAGTLLVRAQGLATLRELQSSLDHGGDPARPIAHGALILVAGVVLLTPGFFTDAVGLALLVPGVRTAVIRHGARHFVHRVHVRQGRRPEERRPSETIIEGDYTVDEESGPRGRSGWTRPE